MRFSPPTFTQTPNELFDKYLPYLGEVELKVLLVIFRKTFGWHKVKEIISISTLEKMTGSNSTNVLKSVKFLVDKGIVKKEVSGPIGKQVTHYELVMHEDSNNSYPYQGGRGTPTNSVAPPPTNSVGVTPPFYETKPPPKEKHKETIKEQQQAAAVFSDSKNNLDASSQTAKVYDCLVPMQIPMEDKVEITQRYKEAAVIHAVAWAKHPKTVIKGPLAAALKWACKKQPEIPKDEEDLSAQNKETVKALDGASSEMAKIVVLNKSIEFVQLNGPKDPFVIYYSDKQFKEHMKHAFRKYKFPGFG